MTATTTKVRPIVLPGDDVRAILDGRKTQFRRIVDPQPVSVGDQIWEYGGDVFASDASMADHLFHNVYGTHGTPYGSVWGDGSGDRLWVKETWLPFDRDHWIGDVKVAYRASTDSDGDKIRKEYNQRGRDYRWRSSIHMPRWASRLTLEITEVRVQRVQEISEEDAIAEGVTVLPLQSINDPSAWYETSPGKNQARSAVGSYGMRWERDHGKGSWSANPWVWARTFRRVKE